MFVRRPLVHPPLPHPMIKDSITASTITIGELVPPFVGNAASHFYHLRMRVPLAPGPHHVCDTYLVCLHDLYPLSSFEGLIAYLDAL